MVSDTDGGHWERNLNKFNYIVLISLDGSRWHNGNTAAFQLEGPVSIPGRDGGSVSLVSDSEDEYRVWFYPSVRLIYSSHENGGFGRVISEA